MDYLIYAAPGAIIFAALWIYSTHNRLVGLDERCKTAFADIDVQLKHRHNIIPSLVETVRGFAGHENEILTAVADARSRALSTNTPEMRLEAETQLGKTLTSMISVVEKYPELKASNHFRDLRIELTDIENRITASRRFYNTTVDELNSTIRRFPGSLIAGRANFSRRQHYDLGAERMLIDEPATFKF